MIVVGLWWMRVLRSHPAHLLVAQRILTDHFHAGRVRFEGSVKALGCEPFEQEIAVRSAGRPSLRIVEGGLSRRAGRD